MSHSVTDLIFEYGLEEAVFEGAIQAPGHCTCRNCIAAAGVQPPPWVAAVFDARGTVEGWKQIKRFKSFVLVLWKDKATTAALDSVARLDKEAARLEAAKLWKAFKAKSTKLVPRIEAHQSARARRADGRGARVPLEDYHREWEKAAPTRKPGGRKKRCPKHTNNGRSLASR